MNSSHPNPGSYDEEIIAWRKSRVQELTGEDGWLTLSGLYWLQPGNNTIGSAPSSAIVLPAGKAPDHAGSIVLSDHSIRIEAGSDG